MSIPQKLVRTKTKVASLMKRRAFSVGVATAACVGFAGDASAQAGEAGAFDWKRNLSMTCFCAGYGGVVYKGMFDFYEKAFTRASLRCGPGGVVMAKVLFDNLVHTPLLYFPLYYSSTGFMNGKSLDEIWDSAKRTFLPNNLASCALWVPGTAVCFAFVPVHLRILYNNVLSFCWNTIMSMISNAKPALPESLACASPILTPALLHLDLEPRMEPEAEEVEEEVCQYFLPQSACSSHDKQWPESSHDPAFEGLDGDDSYKVECTKGLKQAGDRLDSFMKAHWTRNDDQWQQVTNYREAYQQFRSGDAHGCKGDAHDLLKIDVESYREGYRNFRTGAAHGCRTTSAAAVCA